MYQLFLHHLLKNYFFSIELSYALVKRKKSIDHKRKSLFLESQFYFIDLSVYLNVSSSPSWLHKQKNKFGLYLISYTKINSNLM